MTISQHDTIRTTTVATQEDTPQSENSAMPHVTVTVAEGDKRTSGDVSALIALIEQEIAHGKVEDVPAFLGELERLKAILWSKMVTASYSSASNHPSGAVTLLTMPQVAKRLAIPEGRAYELARQGRLPTVKVGKYVRVSMAELETWVEKQTSLERRIDREPPDFHSALARKKRLGPRPHRRQRESRSPARTERCSGVQVTTNKPGGISTGSAGSRLPAESGSGEQKESHHEG
jgi:excisionase family DNA binding protein